MGTMPFVDLALARSLERAEADANRRFVEAERNGFRICYTRLKWRRALIAVAS